jgi:hypothetical protein
LFLQVMKPWEFLCNFNIKLFFAQLISYKLQSKIKVSEICVVIDVLGVVVVESCIFWDSL